VAAASVQISSGGRLAEVIIASEGKPTRVIALADSKTGSNQCEGCGERPATQEGRSQFGWDGKEKFVIFATGEGNFWGSTGREWNLIRLDLETDTGGSGKTREVGSESVAEVEHGGRKFVTDEPLTFGDAGIEGEMAAGPRATQFSGYEKEMAWFGSRAVRGGIFGNRAKKRNREKELSGADGFSADDGKVKFFCEKGKAAVGLTEAGSGAGVRTARGEECGSGCGARGSQVTEGTREGFPAGESGWSGWGEVNPFDNRICF
jgi:hypothetical protein